ncbi:MAG TPA: hypothetical protein VGH39_00795 [Xanthobacteraceae bacterium]
MAAGPTEPDAVPSVENFAVCRGKKQNARKWRAVGEEARLIAIQNPAAAHDPAGMLTTAPKGPPARDTITALDDHRIPERPKRPCRSDQRVTPIDFVRGIPRQIPAKHAIRAADSQAPARRPIRSRDLFNDANERRRISFFATQTTWNPKAK